MTEDAVSRLNAALSDRYLIQGEIGAGGMATVYLARDLKHDRNVAVKVLRPELASVLGGDRFLNEIKVTAGLQHPHILSLHDSGDAGSFLYYVMPYVEGESLRAKLDREGALPVPEAMELLREIADGLAYAHDRGLVHRDIKPDNVLLSGRHALLADLGISKAVSDTSNRGTLTTAGVVLGTPEYMAPEQATADPRVDHRADIYAFGVLAYEMLTGQTPFGGRRGHEVLSAHLVEAPRPLSERRVGLPEGLDSLVMRCLEKSPSDRWQSAEEIVRALGMVGRSEALTGPDVLTRAPGGRGWWRRMAAVAGAVALVGVAGLWILSTFAPRELHARPRIAVLPFENLSGAGEEYFSEGVTRDINTRISRIGDFVVIAHGSAREAKATGRSYLEMARQLGVQYLVDGSVTRVEERVLITASLIDPRTNEQLWTDDYDRELTAEHIFTIRGDVARQVARALDVILSPEQEAELAQEPTENLQAYQDYLLGFQAWEERTIQGFQEAIGHFEDAIAQDSSYALAYAGLADVYLLRPWFSDAFSNREGLAVADSLARRALTLDPALPQPHATLGLVHEWQFRWEEAEGEFTRAIELDPEYATARHWYGLMLARMGRHQEGISQTRASLELDPLSPIINQDVGYALALAGEVDASLRQYERTVELHPGFPTTVLGLALCYAQVGRFEEAGAMLSRWAEVTGNDPEAVREVADLVARHAETGEPQSFVGLDPETVFPPFSLAPLYVLVGQDERALDLLERGYEDRAFGVVASMFGPPVNQLRGHPRFMALAERVQPVP
jgi:TolB-like protein/Tfp pilus assembly protein PilF